ncbi:MAG: serine/threonine protein kinase, partial [Terriglobales bacterium]
MALVTYGVAKMTPEKRNTPVEEKPAQPPPPAPGPLNLSTELAPGTIIVDQYRVDATLGGGGMGSVYRCTDMMVNRSVAIKFLHPHLLVTSKWSLRFQQEAKAIGRLRHPNIIQLHQFSAGHESPFIVMDYVEGVPLSDVLSKETKLSVVRTVQIMSQVASALAHAHENGVVHRDLKPSNIIVVEGTQDEVKILDFGIAKISDEDLTPAQLTQTGEVFGSPNYMSPEQCAGKKIDSRSDQYSFGCVLFECLTGTPPFASDSPIQLMMQQISEAPPTLKEASLGQRFPEHLEQICKKLLAKAPENRFDNMDQVGRVLRSAEDVTLT